MQLIPGSDPTAHSRMSNVTADDRMGEFRRGWKVVVAALLGVGLGLSPLPFYTTGVFAPYLAKEFGWSVGDIMGSLGMTTLMVIWAGPLAGILAVRFGAKAVALTCTALFGLSFIGLAFLNGSLTQYYILWAVIAIVGAGTLPMTWTKGVNNWFDEHKGMALGISLTGTGIFGILSKPYLAWVIDNFGWRGGYVAVGLLPLVIALPVGLLMFREAPPVAAAERELMVEPDGLSLRQTLGQWRFWLLVCAALPLSLGLSGPIPNLEIMLRGSGVPVTEIVQLTPLVGLTAMIGRLAGGWLMDRIWAPAVGFLILGLPALSCWLLTADTLNFWMAAGAIGLLGFALGVEYDLLAFIVARYFGMRSYSAIYACLYVSFALGAGLGPFWFGRSFDLRGNYHSALHISIVLILGAASSLLLLGRYRKFDDRLVDAEGHDAGTNTL